MDNLENEIWKDISGYEGLYQVSNLGRVKSLGKGNGNNSRLKILTSHININGYYQVRISKNNKSSVKTVHRLVAIAFLGKSDLDVNHIDGNKENNNINNLEFVTTRENTIHGSLFRKNKSSKFVGVSFHKRTKKWRAYIQINNKEKHLGYFDSEELASQAYLNKLKELGFDSKYK